VQTIASTHFGDFRRLHHSAKYQLLEAQSTAKEGFVAKLLRSFLDSARQRDSLSIIIEYIELFRFSKRKIGNNEGFCTVSIQEHFQERSIRAKVND
jgi:hypothetical protein